MEGPDHAASLEFEEFSLLVEGVREIEIALGSSNAKSVSQGINKSRVILAKVLSQKQLLRKELF